MIVNQVTHWRHSRTNYVPWIVEELDMHGLPKMQCPAGSRFVELKTKSRAQDTGNQKAMNSQIFERCGTTDPDYWLRARHAKAI